MAVKIPNAPKTLFQSIEFWSDTVKVVDNRIKLIAQTQRFGEVGLTFMIRHGRVVDVIFNETVRMRQIKSDDKKNKKNPNK